MQWWLPQLAALSALSELGPQLEPLPPLLALPALLESTPPPLEKALSLTALTAQSEATALEVLIRLPALPESTPPPLEKPFLLTALTAQSEATALEVLIRWPALLARPLQLLVKLLSPIAQCPSQPTAMLELPLMPAPPAPLATPSPLIAKLAPRLILLLPPLLSSRLWSDSSWLSSFSSAKTDK
jgi:hypothetical protein